MLLPALRDLAGKASVTVVGRRPGLDAIRPYADQTIDLEGQGWHRLFTDAPDGSPLPVSDMDVVTAFFRDEDGMIQRNLKQSLPGAAVHLFRSLPEKRTNIHVAEYLARCLEASGLPVDPGRSMATVRGGGLCKDGLLSGHGRRILWHPGSGSTGKNHPPEFWADLVTRFSHDAALKDFGRVLLLGPAEASLPEPFKAHLRQREVEITTSSDMDSLVDTLNETALYLGHDSGVTHLSAMRCVPTVALFKNSDPSQWAPLGPWVRVLTGQVPGPELAARIVEVARELMALVGTRSCE